MAHEWGYPPHGQEAEVVAMKVFVEEQKLKGGRGTPTPHGSRGHGRWLKKSKTGRGGSLDQSGWGGIPPI
jgi:hypothetical protein